MLNYHAKKFSLPNFVEKNSFSTNLQNINLRKEESVKHRINFFITKNCGRFWKFDKKMIQKGITTIKQSVVFGAEKSTVGSILV